jgi:hypothetical protein
MGVRVGDSRVAMHNIRLAGASCDVSAIIRPFRSLPVIRLLSFRSLVATFLTGVCISCAPTQRAVTTEAGLRPDAKAPAEDAAATLARVDIHRVSTVAPFPRGLAMADGELYVLCRGRVRDAGGVSADIEDQAGTIYRMNPEITEPTTGDVGPAVRGNGEVLARPTEPPFRNWDRTATPPESDRLTDRPYCVLRHHAATKSLYFCAFAGIDKANRPGGGSFSKNLSDGLLRYDLRTKRFYEVERHNIEAGGSYPHHDTSHNPPPHGWLNGPDNCLAVGDSLYAVAKDNNVLVRYDLSKLVDDPEAGAPPSELILGDRVRVKGLGEVSLMGHSALAEHGGYLYIGYRTSSVIVRIPLDAGGLPVRPIEAELIARFRPYDPVDRKSADITDIAFDADGRLYVINAKPARIHRFTPDPRQVYDATAAGVTPWADLAAATGNASMKIEALMVDDRGRVFVSSGDGHAFQNGANGTVYRLDPRDG